jgi:L-lactate dehydrogenase (cytochrome)
MSIVNIEDLRKLARRRLPRVLFDFIDGGSWDEVTMRANRADLEALRFRPHALADVSKRSLAVNVLGTQLAFPAILAPVGSMGLFSRRGEEAAARAAERCGVTICLSTASICSIEEVAAARKTPYWFQLYMGKDRDQARSLVERAQAAGCSALVLTVDTVAGGRRERDVRNGYTVPPKVKLVNALDMLTRWQWMFDVLLGPPIRFGNFPGGRLNFLPIARQMMSPTDPSISWKDVDWLRSLWKGPLLIKGILNPDDARLALEHGAQGVVVSNHGGRQLDGAPSTISVLPSIVEAIGDRGTVIFDGGIRRGQDMLKAIALGAHACFIGRAPVYGLAAMGEAGVERALRILEAEMSTTLALLGRRNIAELDCSVLDFH